MSHIVEIKTEVRDAAAAARVACQRLKLEPPTHGTAKLFSGSATGLIVKLPGWRYPGEPDISATSPRRIGSDDRKEARDE